MFASLCSLKGLYLPHEPVLQSTLTPGFWSKGNNSLIHQGNNRVVPTNMLDTKNAMEH
jgi:hypothetical protein